MNLKTGVGIYFCNKNKKTRQEITCQLWPLADYIYNTDTNATRFNLNFGLYVLCMFSCQSSDQAFVIVPIQL